MANADWFMILLCAKIADSLAKSVSCILEAAAAALVDNEFILLWNPLTHSYLRQLT